METKLVSILKSKFPPAYLGMIQFVHPPLVKNRVFADLFHNTSLPFAVPVIINSLHDAVMKSIFEDKKIAFDVNQNMFQMSYHPFDRTPYEISLDNSNFINGILLCMVILSFFGNMLSNKAMYITKETVNGGKKRQLMAGMDKSSYWVANWVFDFLLGFFPICLICITLASLDFQIISDKVGGLFVLLLLYQLVKIT